MTSSALRAPRVHCAPMTDPTFWWQIVHAGRRIEALPYPISIDVAELRETLASEECQERLVGLRRFVAFGG